MKAKTFMLYVTAFWFTFQLVTEKEESAGLTVACFMCSPNKEAACHNAFMHCSNSGALLNIFRGV